MIDHDPISLAVGAAGLGVIFLSTIPSAIGLISHLRSSKVKSKIYEDKDGVATEEAVTVYSNKLPKIFIFVFTNLGFLAALALAVLGTLHRTKDGFFLENWLNVGAWFLLLIQASSIAIIRSSTKCYTLGLYGAISTVSLLLFLLVEDGLLSQKRSDIGPITPFALRITQLVFTICTGFADVSLPRRPEVQFGGVPVDRMSTGSALVRYSFAWCEHLLVLAGKKKTLDLNDLPKMDHYTRSKDLSEAWLRMKHSGKLWISVFLTHKRAFVTQWVLTLIQAFGTFAPQFVLLHILRILEKRQAAMAVSSEAWIWVVALGLSTILSSWIDDWLFWISWSEIAIPVRSQLSALIFQKAMRRKDVRGTAKSGKKAGVNAAETIADPALLAESAAPDKPEVEEEDEEDDASEKSKQSTVNLIGVDTERISDFCSFNNCFPGSLFELIVSFAFLLSLIGWESLLAGFLAMALTLPINIFFSKRYATAQDRLMKVRDVKMGVVTEALQGIRQIKFSALENQWQGKISQVRSKELVEQWNVFVSNTFLLFCWIASPIALAATSLAVYALLYGELMPSVAFTAIGVFGELEGTLAIIPELTTDLIDAWVSVERIEKYLGAPEISVGTKNAPNISFENASIAWPSDEEKEDGDEQYVLRNVNISFPENELSVVSGKTGTGKSLLLASILGEVDVLSGSINVPKPPPIHERHDHKATKDNWIVPSSIAFVAQVPWIENASIKDNILFGLPFSEYRYYKAIEVCALEKDLNMLTDGESTEVGANGINLSGGQRWRVAFARALYSRAGILVLDDIISAVDAHVGRWIFENGLTGELGVGRTRILVTHHVALCKSKTKYIAELGDGTVQNAGLVQELEEAGTLQQIISHEQTEHDIREDEDNTAVNSEEFSDGEENGEVLRKVDSKAVVTKFVEDEAKEKGSVKQAIYLSYLQSSGGWLFWALALLLFLAEQILMIGSIRASKKLFEGLSFTILRTPLRWIDTVPLGRVLNRLTADFDVVDSSLADDIAFGASNVFELIGAIVAGLFVSPYIILLALTLLGICLHFALQCLASARGVKRLESNAKSPILEQFCSAITGIDTIRAFNKADVYIQRMFKKIDDHSTTYWHLRLFSRWMSWRMSLVGAFFSTAVAIIVIIVPGIDAALAGFALAFSLKYTGTVIWAIRHYTNIELDMNAAERIVEYSNLPTESQDGADPPAAWPSEGNIEVNDLVVGYAPDLPPVLKGLTFRVSCKERVGVVGRTGAGKSSLTLALFRFLEARQGSIYIDGLDISKIKLHSLRSRLAIIPQDPVLFSGTVRSNLDAFDEHTDNELYDALQQVHLVSAPTSRDERVPLTPTSTTNTNQNRNPFSSLLSPISEGGLNLSQGQRQLLCLARAIISRPKIMVLDEATSAVDMVTDALIQRSIREEFTNSTLIVIAHRLSTIVDFDKILVMDNGMVAEFGTPRELMGMNGGVFKGMVGESGEREKLERLIVGGSGGRGSGS
ncbi:P-loop containing nucleoside triphosphate hydrolase protein [Acephala macrosclerotiorum]|nr:P-loop containing nucleoside triphosphate hydrolase protein [Acephala macrosclerotiorum]